MLGEPANYWKIILARPRERGTVIDGTVERKDVVALLDAGGEHELVLMPTTVTVTSKCKVRP